MSPLSSTHNRIRLLDSATRQTSQRGLNSSSSEKLVQIPTNEVLSISENRPPLVWTFKRYLIFAPLLPTTVIGILLLVGNVRQWNVSEDLYSTIINNRGSTQLVVQVVASTLGLLHITVMCMLINYSTRLRLASSPTTLNALKLWNSILSRQLSWDLPPVFLSILVIFLAFFNLPAAIWAASITPIVVSESQPGSIAIPDYANTTLLQQNWTDRYLPSMSTSKGVFSYGVGETFLGSLLYSAATATTVDRRVRDHTKLDHSRFTYYGRSYGMGASVGLLDEAILLNTFATRYQFQESGYAPTVTCIYNSSSAFTLGNDTVDPYNDMLFVAQGYLPNSGSRNEWSRYPGFSTNATVAIGVATIPDAVGRILGIASGNFYPNLNNTQCTIDFRPTIFNITVDIVNRNITVLPISSVEEVTDIDPSGNLTFLSTWQFTLLSTDQTSLYSSLVGNSFNASIANYVTSMSNVTAAPNTTHATLAGLTNSISAMVDDILGCYASAQLMIAKETKRVPTVIIVKALRIGEGQYILSIVIFNAVLLLVLLGEVVRTRGWGRLTEFDYMNPINLVIGISRGGNELAECVDELTAQGQDADGDVSCDGSAFKIGELQIVQEGTRIVLSPENRN